MQPWNTFNTSADKGARAQCDRCGFYYYRRDLRKQMEWQGNSLQWTGWLVDKRCLDVPDIHKKPILIPPDPVPVKDPRPDDGLATEGLAIVTEDGAGFLETEDEAGWLEQDGSVPPA